MMFNHGDKVRFFDSNKLYIFDQYLHEPMGGCNCYVIDPQINDTWYQRTYTHDSALSIVNESVHVQLSLFDLIDSVDDVEVDL